MRIPAAFFYGVALLGLDVWTKNWAHRNLQERDLEIITGFFKLSLVHNAGIAFGLFDDPGGAGRLQWLILILVALVAFALVAVYAMRTPPDAHAAHLAFGFLLGGISGNMLDRIRHSYVVDFLDFNLYFFKFPTFNLADTGITVGVALLLLASWQEHAAAGEGKP